MSLRLYMLYKVNKHLYAFYTYMRNLSRAGGAGAWVDKMNLCWLRVVSVHQFWPLRTSHHASCSLPILRRKRTIASIHSLIFTKGVTYTVYRILTFVTRLTSFCLRSLHLRARRLDKTGHNLSPAGDADRPCQKQV
jgi:hypothetical protein